MNSLLSYVRSSIGKKQILAVAGIAIVVFLFFHLAGNLLVFAGRDATNSYAVSLREHPFVLWTARGGLLAAFLVHIVVATSLWLENQSARSRRYQVFRPRRTSFYARAMILTGSALLFYVLFHLLHFTFGLYQSANHALLDAQGRHDVYRMVVLGFQNPLVSAIYIVSMALLALHLAHGIPSFFQTLGLRHHKVARALDVVGPLIALLFFLGFSSIPLAAMTGVLQP